MAPASKVILHPKSRLEKLPFELVDLVVDHLNNDVTSPTELAPLLRVSRSFANPVKRRLFSTIKVTYFHFDKKQPRSVLLRAILRGDPTILDYVRRVEIVFDKEDSYFLPEDGQKDLRNPNPINHRTFLHILETLSKCRVNELDICGKNVKGRTWPSLYGVRATAAIYALRCNPHLRKLSIHHLREFPGFMITGLPSTDRVEELSTTYALYIFSAVSCDCSHCGDESSPAPDNSRRASRKLRIDPAKCLKMNPLVQQLLKEKDVRPFSRLKTLHLPRKGEFPWEVCFPVVCGSCLDYCTDQGLERNYETSEGDEPTVPRLSDFQFSSLERLIIGNKGVETRIRLGCPHNYESVIDILDRVGANFKVFELRDRFYKGLHDVPTFPLNGIFKSGRIPVFHINTHDLRPRDSWDYAASMAYDEFDSIATFFSHNAPLPGVNEVSLSLMWPMWEVVGGSLFENFHAGGSTPWERFCAVIKNSAVQTVKIAVRVRTLRRWPLSESDANAVSNIRTRWMEAMDLGKDVAVEFNLVVDASDSWEWDAETGDSDVWY